LIVPEKSFHDVGILGIPLKDTASTVWLRVKRPNKRPQKTGNNNGWPQRGPNKSRSYIVSDRMTSKWKSTKKLIRSHTYLNLNWFYRTIQLQFTRSQDYNSFSFELQSMYCLLYEGIPWRARSTRITRVQCCCRQIVRKVLDLGLEI
jgi:hypothetical protein